MKIAIGFFGITRSLKYTIDSIKNNIFNILIKNNIEYDVYMHTYNLTNYKNIRTKENINDEDIDNEEYKLLQPDFVEIDIQEDIKQKINLFQYRTFNDPWNTNYNSVDNFILGQYSKQKLTNMIKKQNFNYDYVLFMRPDCLYLESFKIDFFNLVNDNSIIIPNFHLFGSYNFNDRFCITNMNTYNIYGCIFDNLLEISKNNPLHSETVIGKIIFENKINVIRVKFNFSRVRFNGLKVDNF
jgi:hypothetical protein